MNKSTTDLLIRLPQSADRSRWDELWAGYLDFYRERLPQEVTEHTWQRLIDPQAPLHGFLAVHKGHVVGFVHYHFHLSTWSTKGYCYLEDLFVDPAVRGIGAGRALIEAVYDAADAYGAARVYWHTENDNARAQALYNQLAKVAPFMQYRRKPTLS